MTASILFHTTLWRSSFPFNVVSLLCIAELSVPCEVRSLIVASSITGVHQQDSNAYDENYEEHPTDSPETPSNLTFAHW